MGETHRRERREDAEKEVSHEPVVHPRTMKMAPTICWGCFARRTTSPGIFRAAHSILVSVYYMLRDKVSYKDLGANHFDRLNPERLKRYHLKRLRALGCQVTIVEDVAA